jgi:hypothetical protein
MVDDRAEFVPRHARRELSQCVLDFAPGWHP